MPSRAKERTAARELSTKTKSVTCAPTWNPQPAPPVPTKEGPDHPPPVRATTIPCPPLPLTTKPGDAIEPGKARARTLIHARGVAKSYRTGDGDVESLRPLEFEVSEGEFVSVVGPSGCGKSTLHKLIAGLLPASRGSIEIGGATVDGPPPGIGIVFQSHVLLPWRTVLANILLQAEVRGLAREQSVERARKLVARLVVDGAKRTEPPATLPPPALIALKDRVWHSVSSGIAQ